MCLSGTEDHGNQDFILRSFCIARSQVDWGSPVNLWHEDKSRCLREPHLHIWVQESLSWGPGQELTSREQDKDQHLQGIDLYQSEGWVYCNGWVWSQSWGQTDFLGPFEPEVGHPLPENSKEVSPCPWTHCVLSPLTLMRVQSVAFP